MEELEVGDDTKKVTSSTTLNLPLRLRPNGYMTYVLEAVELEDTIKNLDRYNSTRCIGDQNCHSLGYGVELSSCFCEKVHQVKLKYEK
ncbi:hypothetical protein JHK85_053770 [Glycine max]|nr:hypothetical protein JHK85_053770 [Glycine max]